MGRTRKYEDIPYIAEAFRKDALLLLQKFCETESFSFKGFADLWVKMKFSLVYMGKENVRELRAFTHECFNVTFQIIMGEQYTFLEKVGAVYLLYGLYFKQVEDVMYKIRMDDSRWAKMFQMLKDGQEAEIPDLVFVILKLMNSMAFHTVKCLFLMGPKLVSQQARDSSFAEQILKPDVADELSILQYGALQPVKSALQAYENMWNFMVESGKFTYTQPWEKKVLKDREDQQKKVKSLKDPLFWINRYISCKTLKDLRNWQTELGNVAEPPEESIGTRRLTLKSNAMTTVQKPQKMKRIEKFLGHSSDEEQKSSDKEALSPNSYYTRGSIRRELGIRVEGTTTEDENESDVDGNLQREFNDVALLEESDSDYKPPVQTKKKVVYKKKRVIVAKKREKKLKKRGRRKLPVSEKLVPRTKCQIVKASHEYSRAIKGKKIIQHFKDSDDEDD